MINNDLKNKIVKYAAYNLWANKKLANWLRNCQVSIVEQATPSSFPSIKATLSHILYGEDVWLERLKNKEGRFEYGQDFDGTVDELLNELLSQSEQLLNYTQQLSGNEIQEKHQFSIPYVGDFNQSKFDMLHHCLNHSTYHRGQIVTIARALGITEDIPMTDYLIFPYEE